MTVQIMVRSIWHDDVPEVLELKKLRQAAAASTVLSSSSSRADVTEQARRIRVHDDGPDYGAGYDDDDPEVQY